MLNLSSLLPVDLLDVAHIALQLVACAVAILLGVVLAKLVNRWVQRAADRGVQGWHLRVLELLAIATGPIVIYGVLYPLSHYFISRDCCRTVRLRAVRARGHLWPGAVDRA